MNLPHVNPRQLKLISGYSLRHSMRSGSGLVFLLLAVFFGLIVANAVISPYEMRMDQIEEQGLPIEPEQAERQLVTMARPVIEWAIAPPDVDDAEVQEAAEVSTARWADYLLDERPALLSAIFLVLIFGIPLLIPFGAFNQTAGDIGNRGLRYLLQRTERANIYYGRLLATMVLTVAVQALVLVTIGFYVGLNVQIYGGMDVATWSLQGLLALAVLSLPYVAVCAWLSASTDSAMVSLVLSSLVIGGVLLGAFLGGMAWEPARYINYLLPWGIQNHLLAPGIGTVALTVLACLAYTALFTWLGARRFETRDL